jgi:tetratricopeptide (TPR) repeat protein
VSAPAAPEHPPQIGRFTVLGTLGRGGMGVVYTAYDPELDRKVALKLVHLAGPGDQLELARARLLHEAQTMARLSHPAVVAVYEAGAVDDQVYLAMEYVKGETLRAWARTPRPWREVLAAYAQAGAGLAAAHRAGVVHRDFKPDNVLVDPQGRVRVVDFGLAATEGEAPALQPVSALSTSRGLAGSINARLAAGLQELSPGPHSTWHRTGGQIVGTPAYMAPEQFMGGAADARADQFGFCAALYEALHGERPVPGNTLGELRQNLFQGVRHQPPPGSPVPPWLRRILLRGLDLDPEQRFPDMDALLAALARDPGQARRRALLAAAAVLALVAALAAGYASRRLQEDRERAARDAAAARCAAAGPALVADAWDDDRRAAVERALLAAGTAWAADTAARVRARLDAHAAELRDMAETTCTSAQVRGDLAPAAFERRMVCLRRQRAELEALTAALAAADAKVAERAVQAVVALPPPSRCAEARADDRHDDALEALRLRLARARSQAGAGRYADAGAEARAVAEAAAALGDPGLHAEALLRRGAFEEAAGEFKAAEATLTAAYFAAEQAARDDLRAEAAPLLAGIVGIRLARVAEGQTWLRHGEAVAERTGLAGELRARLRTVESGLSRVQGRLGDAGEQAAEALALARRAFGDDDPRVATPTMNLGTHFLDRADHPRAERHYRRALEILEQSLGPQHPDLAGPLNNLGNALEKQGRFVEAEQALSRALAIREASVGDRHPGVAISRTNLGVLAHRQGDPARAEGHFRRAAAIFEAVLGPDHPNLGSALGGLGRALVAQGRLAEARPLHLRAREILEKSLGPGHALLAYPLVDLAELDLAADDPAAAVAPATRALELRSAGDARPEERAAAQLALSRALWRSGQDRPRAVRLADEAAAALGAAGPGFRPELDEAVTWRRSLRDPR